MSTDDDLKTIKDTVSIVGEIIKAAGDNPNVKQAGNELGQTALTITKAINNVLLPIAALNYGFEKARVYFSEKFSEDLSEKLASVPADQIIGPKPSIVGPALQGLAFSHEEPDLKELYLRLIASAMDARVAKETHPAFVEIIRQINAEEAVLLKEILFSWTLPIATIVLRHVDTKASLPLMRHVTNMNDDVTQQPIENRRFPAMVDNWIRLGLVEVNYAVPLTADYGWLQTRPEIARFRAAETEKQKVDFVHGSMRRTDFGLQFAHVVGIVSSNVITLTFEGM